MEEVLKIGTRGSPLAIAQTTLVLQQLRQSYPNDDYFANAELVEVKTTGDRILDRSLADIGGKALFTKEIDRALLEGHCDVAVHSLKDVETKLAPGIVIAAIAEREDTREVWISREGTGLRNIAPDSLFGSCAPRRIAQVRHLRPDLRFTTLRGNVHSRMHKIQTGVIDAALFACAGLKRAGIMSDEFELIPHEVVLPAVSQGAMAITCRAEDQATYEILRAINHKPTETAVTAERAMLTALGGSCRTPIAGYAELNEGEISLAGLIAAEDGSKIVRDKLTGEDPISLGEELAERLIAGSDGEYRKWQAAS